MFKRIMISKNRSFFVNTLISAADSAVTAYVMMFFIWLFSGMNMGLPACAKAWAVSYILIFGAMVIISYGLQKLKWHDLDLITDHAIDKGFDDEYFAMLKDYMCGDASELKPSQQLVFASCYLEGGRYADCRTQLEKVDFKSLTPAEQEEYFNTCLYSAVLENNIDLANDIYNKSRHYFDRAIVKKRGSYVLHTLGMLCYINGRLENAYKLFETAGKGRSDGLKCECSIGKGLVYLASGDKEGAKEMCFAAAGLAETYMQACRLKDLMMKVEKAYRAKAVKTEMITE